MENREEACREQQDNGIIRNPDGTFAKGSVSPGGFQNHPENRHNGSWHKENTPRYWLEEMMKMDSDELNAIINGREPVFKKNMAQCIIKGEWKEIKEMIQEVYGKMPEFQVTMEADDETKEGASKIIRGFALP